MKSIWSVFALIFVFEEGGSGRGCVRGSESECEREASTLLAMLTALLDYMQWAIKERKVPITGVVTSLLSICVLVFCTLERMTTTNAACGGMWVFFSTWLGVGGHASFSIQLNRIEMEIMPYLQSSTLLKFNIIDKCTTKLNDCCCTLFKRIYLNEDWS